MVLEAEERGRRQGEEQIERIDKLNAFLIKEKRFEDLEHATNDKKFRQQLMEQYGI